MRIPIAIHNGGPTPLEGPAYLRSSDNLLEVIGGAGIGEDGLLLFLNADSTDVAVAGGEEVVRYIWWYDDQFPKQDGVPFLEPGERTTSPIGSGTPRSVSPARTG